MVERHIWANHSNVAFLDDGRGGYEHSNDQSQCIFKDIFKCNTC